MFLFYTSVLLQLLKETGVKVDSMLHLALAGNLDGLPIYGHSKRKNHDKVWQNLGQNPATRLFLDTHRRIDGKKMTIVPNGPAEMSENVHRLPFSLGRPGLPLPGTQCNVDATPQTVTPPVLQFFGGQFLLASKLVI